MLNFVASAAQTAPARVTNNRIRKRILLIAFIARVGTLTKRLQWLEGEFYRLKGPPTPGPFPQQPTTMDAPVTLVRTTTVNYPPPPPAEPVQETVVAHPAPVEERRSQAREEWEAFVGGKLLNRIGALALTIGVGFFLKYAFDNNWITETMRVLLGGVVGVVLLILGAHFHRKEFSFFAQGLIGAGIAILYLSAFASFNYYHLVSQLTAFLLMSVVTLIAFYHAIRDDSLAISILGWAGGYLTPFLLSTGVSNEAGLFAYIDVLEAGLLAVVIIRQKWIVLELLTLIGTYVVYALWYSEYYTEEALTLTALFLGLFWVLFYLVNLYRLLTDPGTHPMPQVVNALNAGIFFAFFYGLVNAHHHPIMGWLTALLACLYVVPAILALRRNPQSLLVRDHILISVILLIIATAIQFTGFTTVTLWAAEGLALMWCANRYGYRYLAVSVLLFHVLVIGKLLFTQGAFSYVPTDEFTLFLNRRFLAYIGVAASMGFNARLLASIDIKNNQHIREMIHLVWCILVFVALTCEIVDYFAPAMRGADLTATEAVEFTRNITLLAVWMVYSLPLIYFGLKPGLVPVLLCGLGLTGVIFAIALVWGITFRPIQNFHPVWNLRALGLLFVLGASVFTGMWLRQARGQVEVARDLYPVLLVSQAILLLMLFTVETRDVFEFRMFMLREQRGESPINDTLSVLENMEQLFLSALWLVYGILLMIAGIWRRLRGMRILAIIILGIAVLKIFIYDLSFLQTLYRIFSFIGLGLILLAASYMYQRYKAMIFGSGVAAETNEPDQGGA